MEAFVEFVKTILRHWLPIAAVATLLCALVYMTVQQSLRMGANDPQIQMAEDAADALAGGAAPESLLPASRIDIARSLAPFLVIYNQAGEPLAASGLLHGQSPVLPLGVLDYVRTSGEDRLTWQPEGDVRIAAVVTSYTGPQTGFVLAGRSLREVEKRESQTESIVGVTWLVALAGSLVVAVLSEFVLSGKERS